MEKDLSGMNKVVFNAISWLDHTAVLKARKEAEKSGLGFSWHGHANPLRIDQRRREALGLKPHLQMVENGERGK